MITGKGDLLILEKVLRTVDLRDTTLPTAHPAALLPPVEALLPRIGGPRADVRQRRPARREEVRVDRYHTDRDDGLDLSAVIRVVREQFEGHDYRREPARLDREEIQDDRR